MRLLILGATGGTGEQLTRQALERGHIVTAFVRSPEKIRAKQERLRIVKGDPKDADQIDRALRDQDAVLSALGSSGMESNGILEAAAHSTVDAMRRTEVRRLMVVSMALLFPDVGPLGPVLRFFLRRHLRDSAAMEAVVEASGLDWTIVRPPRLTNGTAKNGYQITERGAPPGFSMARADLARAILDFVEQGAHVGKVIGIST